MSAPSSWVKTPTVETSIGMQGLWISTLLWTLKLASSIRTTWPWLQQQPATLHISTWWHKVWAPWTSLTSWANFKRQILSSRSQRVQSRRHRTQPCPRPSVRETLHVLWVTRDQMRILSMFRDAIWSWPISQARRLSLAVRARSRKTGWWREAQIRWAIKLSRQKLVSTCSIHLTSYLWAMEGAIRQIFRFKASDQRSKQELWPITKDRRQMERWRMERQASCKVSAKTADYAPLWLNEWKDKIEGRKIRLPTQIDYSSKNANCRITQIR